MTSLSLRPYQAEAVDALRDNVRKGVRRQVLCMPTGSGKTVVAMALIAAALRQGSRAYFAADRLSLVEQTSARFHEFGIPHGILRDKKRSRRLWEDALICSSQTLEARGFAFERPAVGIFEYGAPAPDPDLLVIDECDEIRQRLIKYVIDRDILTLGLSATPFSKGIGGIYETVVNVTTTTELIASEDLVPVTVVAPPRVQVEVDGCRLKANGEWDEEDLSERVMQITGDVVTEWEKHTAFYFEGPVPTIGFFPTVADATDAAERFQRAGHDFRVISYRNTPELNQAQIEAFREGKHVGLLSCVALTKGFDVPQVQCMIDAYPLRRALGRHIQKVGRTMRPFPGKTIALLIDAAGNWLGFRVPTRAFFDHGVDRLDSSKHRNATRNTNPESLASLKCHECGFVWPERAKDDPPITVCPLCGAARKRARRTLHVAPGSLEQIDVVDGKGQPLPWEGDWWPELCAVASAITPDDERAGRIAFAKHHWIFGRYPPTGTAFARVNRYPHPVVEEYSRKGYGRWLATR